MSSTEPIKIKYTSKFADEKQLSGNSENRASNNLFYYFIINYELWSRRIH